MPISTLEKLFSPYLENSGSKVGWNRSVCDCLKKKLSLVGDLPVVEIGFCCFFPGLEVMVWGG